MRRPSKKEHKAKLSQAITQIIWSEVVIEFNGDLSDRQKAEDLYKRKLCELPTRDIEFILKTCKDGLMPRRGDTIDALETEIATRGLLNAEVAKKRKQKRTDSKSSNSRNK
jgi:hypothetical protein